jgi:hypothetical protein
MVQMPTTGEELCWNFGERNRFEKKSCPVAVVLQSNDRKTQKNELSRPRHRSGKPRVITLSSPRKQGGKERGEAKMRK